MSTSAINPEAAPVVASQEATSSASITASASTTAAPKKFVKIEIAPEAKYQRPLSETINKWARYPVAGQLIGTVRLVLNAIAAAFYAIAAFFAGFLCCDKKGVQDFAEGFKAHAAQMKRGLAEILFCGACYKKGDDEKSIEDQQKFQKELGQKAIGVEKVVGKKERKVISEKLRDQKHLILLKPAEAKAKKQFMEVFGELLSHKAEKNKNLRPSDVSTVSQGAKDDAKLMRNQAYRTAFYKEIAPLATKEAVRKSLIEKRTRKSEKEDWKVTAPLHQFARAPYHTAGRRPQLFSNALYQSGKTGFIAQPAKALELSETAKCKQAKSLVRDFYNMYGKPETLGTHIGNLIQLKKQHQDFANEFELLIQNAIMNEFEARGSAEKGPNETGLAYSLGLATSYLESRVKRFPEYAAAFRTAIVSLILNADFAEYTEKAVNEKGREISLQPTLEKKINVLKELYDKYANDFHGVHTAITAKTRELIAAERFPERRSLNDKLRAISDLAEANEALEKDFILLAGQIVLLDDVAEGKNLEGKFQLLDELRDKYSKKPYFNLKLEGVVEQAKKNLIARERFENISSFKKKMVAALDLAVKHPQYNDAFLALHKQLVVNADLSEFDTLAEKLHVIDLYNKETEGLLQKEFDILRDRVITEERGQQTKASDEIEEEAQSRHVQFDEKTYAQSIGGTVYEGALKTSGSAE